MKRNIAVLIFAFLAVAGVFRASALTVKTLAGALAASVDDARSVTTLTVKGELNIKDFEFITMEMTALESLDMSEATIAAYSGEATLTGRTSSPADELPECALMRPTLRHVVLPVNLKAIGAGALGSSGITSVTIPATVRTIGDSAFGECRSLESVTVPAGVTEIGINLFKGCESLESAVIEAPVATLPDNTFLGCESLKNVSLPSSVTAIGNSAFAGCGALAGCDLPAGLKSIGDRAFYGTGLRSLRLAGTSVETIGAWAFADCPDLATVEFDAGVKTIGKGAFYNDGALGLSALPDKLTAVSDFSLRGIATAPENLMENARIDSIGAYAMANWTGIQTFKLPAALNHIGEGGMANWSDLRTLSATQLTEVPLLGADVWRGINQSDVSLIVPEDLESAFRSADQWKEFNVRTGQTDIGAVEEWPMPGSGIKARFEGLNLIIEAPAEIAGVQLYDVSGRSYTLPVRADNCRATIDTSAWNAPVMIVRVVLTDGSGAALKLTR